VKIVALCLYRIHYIHTLLKGDWTRLFQPNVQKQEQEGPCCIPVGDTYIGKSRYTGQTKTGLHYKAVSMLMHRE
jgi:hypothetical protein